MKSFYIVLLLLVSLNSFCQKKISVELLTGVGINQKIALINEDIESYKAVTTQINANYRFKLIKAFFAETGLGVQSYYTRGDIGLSEFGASTFRLNLPFIISHPVSEKASIGLGASIANNRDLKVIKFREDNNLRTSLVLKGEHNLNEYCNLVLLMKHNLTDVPDLFLVNQPKIDISIGVSFKLL